MSFLNAFNKTIKIIAPLYWTKLMVGLPSTKSIILSIGRNDFWKPPKTWLPLKVRLTVQLTSSCFADFGSIFKIISRFVKVFYWSVFCWLLQADIEFEAAGSSWTWYIERLVKEWTLSGFPHKNCSRPTSMIKESGPSQTPIFYRYHKDFLKGSVHSWNRPEFVNHHLFFNTFRYSFNPSLQWYFLEFGNFSEGMKHTTFTLGLCHNASSINLNNGKLWTSFCLNL
jgi:hypothetical protein